MTTAGPVAEYNDARAVAASLAFRDYGVDFFNTPLVVATPTLTTYRLVTTPVLATGLWQVTLELFVTGSNSGTFIGMDVEIDGFSLGIVLTSASVPGGGFVISTTIAQAWAGGTHTVEYLINQPSGPGQVTGQNASTTWVREQ